ncbi:MAG TPA: hypothetical protein VI112_04560 [Bacteroidia bacterium]|jgi:hypothetical protein
MNFTTENEIKTELETADFQSKLTAYSGRQYPIEYLSSREFEILVYFIFKKEIELGINSDKYDTIFLMKGTSERGRDCILQCKNKNVGVIQCKRYTTLISKPDLAREIIKFALHAIQDSELITEATNYTYYFIALQGFRDTTLVLLKDFNKNILSEPKLHEWVNEVIEENEELKFKDYAEVKNELEKILSKITVKPITGLEIDQKLKSSKEIVSMFFEIEKVASEDMLRKVFSEYFEFKNDEDLEKLRQKLKDVPKENRMFFGLFSIYGYDIDFYKRLVGDKKLLFQIADIKTEINKRYIDYLNETIRKYQLLFISGLPNISPFTKQVVVPYLFNKYALKYNETSMGQFLSQIVKGGRKGVIYEFQTIDQHKAHLLEIGEKVLKNDFPDFVGDEELLKFKKEVSYWTHKDFKTVEEMSERFDKDMVILKPILDKIEEQLVKITPVNPTIIIEDKGLGETEKDFVDILKGVQKFDPKK